MKTIAIFPIAILFSCQSFALPICLQEIDLTATETRPSAPFGAKKSHQDGFDLVLEMDQPSCRKIRKFKPFSKIISKGDCLKTFNVVGSLPFSVERNSFIRLSLERTDERVGA